MDPIAHGLLGAVTAQLGFRQRIGRDATWVAAVAALLPDLDALAAPLMSLTGAEHDSMTTLRYHRGLSHSLLLMPVLALAAAGIWWALRRRVLRGRFVNGLGPPPFLLMYLCVLAAVVTHPLLDWCTSYGTQLFAPLTHARYAFDAVPILDIFYMPLLALTLVACWIVRLASRGRARRAALVIGWTGFLLSVGYLGAGRLMHNWAIQRTLPLADGEEVLRADAYPALGSIFLWRTVIETEHGWRATRVHLFNARPPQTWPSRYAPKIDNPWIDRARATEEYHTYFWFAGERVRAEYQATDGLHTVRFHDMRYSAQPEGLESFWPLLVQFDDAGDVMFVGRKAEYRGNRVRRNVAEVWHELWNP